MKRTIVASILGIAACAVVNQSYGQGNLIFNNYGYNSSSVLISEPVTSNGVGVDSSFTAALYWSPTGAAGTFNTLIASTPFNDAPYNGSFAGNGATVTLADGYTGGPAYFEIEYYNGSSYANATIRGISNVIEYSTLATAANLHLPGTPIAALNPDVVIGLTPTAVLAVPEPTTLALAGLGGLASLMALRRKNA